VSLLRRVGFVIIGTVAYHSDYRHTVYAIFAWICLAMHLRFQPFRTQLENWMETASLSALALIAILLAANNYPHPTALVVLVAISCIIPAVLGGCAIIMSKAMQRFYKKKKRPMPWWLAPSTNPAVVKDVHY